MFETRKYFDYELAYELYERVKNELKNGGTQALLDDEELAISGGGTLEDWACNGYVPLYACGYNATIYLSDRNFDTTKEENDWYVSGEVDIYSYGGGDDTLYINDNITINDRINGLIDYARKNDYSLEDLFSEYDSLVAVLEKIGSEENED